MSSKEAVKTDSQPSKDQPTFGEPAVLSQPGYGQPGTAHGQPAAVVYGQPAYQGNTVMEFIHPRQIQQHQTFVVPPEDYLALSIVSIFFFCPFAIYAIVFSCLSKRSAEAGDMASAQSNGIAARNYSIAAILLGLVIFIVAIISLLIKASHCGNYFNGHFLE